MQSNLTGRMLSGYAQERQRPDVVPGRLPSNSLSSGLRAVSVLSGRPNDPGTSRRARLIRMRFQAYKISGGRGVLKNAPSPGPPSPKTFRILVSCFDRRSSASLTDIFKKFLVEGFGEAPSCKAAPQRILISLNAHWYDHHLQLRCANRQGGV